MLSVLPGYLAEACRLYVLATLAAAVVGKARDLAGFRAAVAQLTPVPAAFVAPVAAAVIAAELALALLLALGGPWAEAGLAGGLLLFVAFAAVIVTALQRGQAVSCSCFGPSGRRISASDLVRSLTLVAACGAALAVRGEARLPPAAEALAFVAMLGLVAGSVWLQERLAPPKAAPITGRPAPDFNARRLNGEAVAGPEIFRGQPSVLVFVAGGCPKCLAAVAALRGMLGDMARAGVALWITPVAVERQPFPEVTDDPLLAPHVLQMELDHVRRLNPDVIAPAYLFVDHDGVALAFGLVGDDDWQAFAAQILAEAA